MKKTILLLSLIIGAEVAFPDISSSKIESINNTSEQTNTMGESIKKSIDAFPNEFTISLYTGLGGTSFVETGCIEHMGDINVGGSIGLGTELMYKNVSINLGLGYTPALENVKTIHPYIEHADDDYCVSDLSHVNNIKGSSIGVKIYNPMSNSKDKIFAGINLINTSFSWGVKEDEKVIVRDKDGLPVDIGEANRDLYEKFNTRKIAITGGYKHTISDRMYISSYAGIEKINMPNRITTLFINSKEVVPCFGINVGYQLK